MTEPTQAALPAQGGDDWPWLRDLLTEMSSVASGIPPNIPSAKQVLAAVPEQYRVAAGLPYDPSFDDRAPCCLPGTDCPHVERSKASSTAGTSDYPPSAPNGENAGSPSSEAPPAGEER